MAEKKVIEIEIQDNSKTLKQQYKEAVLEVQKLADAFGATSVEVQNASKKAAELKDQIEDVNDAIQAQKGEGAFIALGKSISAVANGFSAVQGAMGLVGVESEEVQQAMLRVQSAMALAQGLEGLEDAGRAFKQLGAVVKSTTIFTSAYNFVVYGTTKATTAQTIATGIQTGATTGATTATKLLRLAMLSLPIVAIVAGLVALANSMGVFGDKTEDAEAKQKRLDEQLEKTNKQIEKQKRATDSLNEIIDKQTRIDLINAKNRGASEAELIRIQEEGAKRRIKVLEEEAKQAEKLYLKMSKTGSTAQFEAAEKSMLESQKALSDARLSLQEAQAERRYKTITDNAKKTNEELDLTKDEAYIAEQKRLAELNKLELDSLKTIEDAKKANADMLLTEQELAIQKENEAYKIKLDNAILFGQDTEALEIEHLNNINNINLTAQEKQYAIDKEAKDKQIALDKETAAKKLEIEKALQEHKAELRQKDFDLALQGIAVIKSIFEKSKGVQKAAVIAESAIGIAKIITSTQAANAAAIAKYSAIPGGQAFSAAEIARNRIGAGIGIAANLTATAKALQALGGGSAPSGGGDLGGATGGGVIAPNLNVVGNTGINQLATLQQQPVKAYVVSNDITSAQQFDLKVQQTASL